MNIRHYFAGLYLLFPLLAWSQQANVNLDYSPQKNTENLIPFSAPLNSPEVHDDRTVTVEYGLIQGTSEDGLTLYRGIPFAAFGGDPNRVTIC